MHLNEALSAPRAGAGNNDSIKKIHNGKKVIPSTAPVSNMVNTKVIQKPRVLCRPFLSATLIEPYEVQLVIPAKFMA